MWGYVELTDRLICVVFLLVNVPYGLRFSYWPYLTKLLPLFKRQNFCSMARHITVEKCTVANTREILINFSNEASQDSLRFYFIRYT